MCLLTHLNGGSIQQCRGVWRVVVFRVFVEFSIECVYNRLLSEMCRRVLPWPSHRFDTDSKTDFNLQWVVLPDVSEATFSLFGSLRHMLPQ